MDVKEEQGANWAIIALVLALFEDSFGGLYFLTRVFWIPEIAHLNKIITALVLFFCFISLLRNPIKTNRISVMMVLMLFIGIFSAIINWGEGESRAFLSQLSHWTLMLVCFTAASSITWDLKRLYYYLVRLAVIISLLNLVFFMLMEFIRHKTGQAVYTGSSSEELMVPYFLSLSLGNYFYSFIVALQVLMSGKRGPLLGIICVSVLFLIFKKSNRSFLSAIVKSSMFVIIGFVIVSILLISFKPSEFFEKGSALQRVIYKNESAISRLYSSNENYKKQLDLASSGRSAELISAWSVLTENYWTFFFGRGYGWNLDVYLYDGSSSDETHLRYHYLHFSPLNIAVSYGVLVLILFYGSIFVIVGRCWKQAKNIVSCNLNFQDQKLITFLILLFLGKLVVSLTAYNQGVDPVYWIVFGILVSISSRTPYEACLVDKRDALD